ncbi:hypothetical protein [Thalassotalea sp. PLHSN55]|uniref:hypothetical protein n=1 Tax=Thalassotalea sp. PLHSN55 TaxID=3435888 RepID=UPI003F869F10
MNKLLILLLIIYTPLGLAHVHSGKGTPNSTATNAIVLDAINDFSSSDKGDVPYYQDKRNASLAIDARVVHYRNLFAKAEYTFAGEAKNYDLTITVLTEEDGEPVYRLLINNVVVGTYKSSYIGKDSPRDLKAETHTWRAIHLKKGDVIAIESSSNTNGEIPEHGGTAWARGRWQQLALVPSTSANYQRDSFRTESDLLLAQFDSKPDADDIHAIAALGSMLSHADMKSVNYVAVAGAVGIQTGEYIDSPELFTLAFGRENLMWTNAHKHWHKSVNFIRDRVRAVLTQGGKVWVQEAGQSNFTRDWLVALQQSGVDKALIKNNVIVVQHSAWNENKTSPDALTYVKQATRYHAINDGNEAMKEFNRKGRRGALTPKYVDTSKKWLTFATSNANTNTHSQLLWKTASRIVDASGFTASHSVVPQGGVDFSDVVESWWIFELGHRAPSVHAFWKRYVTTATLDVVKPPKGRLAVVIDGNSPDPDDIGATPVMFALLNKTGLNETLVHLSHSCDLDPFRNKGKQQINAVNELRRQKKLDELSVTGIELFGPFENLRKFYNCREDQQGATRDLTDAINASTANNPLWIIEAGEPDLIGYALAAAKPSARQHVHVISHHPANDNSGDYFTWQQILDFGITEHQIGDQNVGLQTPMHYWDWTNAYNDSGFNYIMQMLAYAESDGVVPFQTNKYDCSDAGMLYWWITGANNGGNNSPTPVDIKEMLLQTAK